MGMAASQMRLLALTARKSDLEYSAQQLSNVKIQLANKSEEASNAYVNALAARKLTITTVDASASNTNYLATNDLTLAALESIGYVVHKLSGGTPSGAALNSHGAGVSNTTLSAGLISGEFVIYKKGESPAVSVSIAEITAIQEVEDDSGFALAEAVYTQETSKLQRKEKQIDMQINRIDTEHRAIEAEYDSVRNVIKDNVEESFSIFG